MGALQPGLPSPTVIPKGYSVFVIELQDCFSTIPLHPDDRNRFAFSLPSINLQRPYQRFQWKVLPQGMKNSPTLCQKFVDMAVSPIRQQFPELLPFHYMDDILIVHSSLMLLNQALDNFIQNLHKYGLTVAPEKIQKDPHIIVWGELFILILLHMQS